jgi:hypothetical protein
LLQYFTTLVWVNPPVGIIFWSLKSLSLGWTQAKFTSWQLGYDWQSLQHKIQYMHMFPGKYATTWCTFIIKIPTPDIRKGTEGQLHGIISKVYKDYHKPQLKNTLRLMNAQKWINTRSILGI